MSFNVYDQPVIPTLYSLGHYHLVLKSSQSLYFFIFKFTSMHLLQTHITNTMLWSEWKKKNIDDTNSTWYLISKQSMTQKWINKSSVMLVDRWCLQVERDQRNCLSWAGHTNNTWSKAIVHYYLGHDVIMAGQYWY